MDGGSRYLFFRFFVLFFFDFYGCPTVCSCHSGQKMINVLSATNVNIT